MSRGRACARAFLAAAVLAGCASREPPADPRDTWAGATYDQVVQAWGRPVRSTDLADGRKAYTWVSEGSLPQTGVSPSIGIGVGSGGVSIGTGMVFGSARGEPARCERTLIFEGGLVMEQNWQGTAAYCNGFGRPR